MSISETTPLLTGAESDFPSILTAVQRLPPEPSFPDLIATHSASHTSPPLAFHLLLVLHLLVTQRSDDLSPSRRESPLDAWYELQRRSRRRECLRLLACELLEYPQSLTDEVANRPVQQNVYIEDILLACFSFDSSKSQMIRVIDLLSHPAVPPEILSHPVITMSLTKVWKYGVAHRDPLESEVPVIRRFLALYVYSAPRATHAVHLVLHTTYLFLLVHLILYPSPRPIFLEAPGGPLGIREPIISVYSVTNILFAPFSFSSFPHILVLVSFLFSLPASPSPDSTAYLALLPGFCLHVLALHMPIFPTPLLLFEPARCLPLSSLYAVFLKQCFFPTLIFLFPVLLTSAVLLSLSLAEAPSLFLQTSNLSAPPPAARVTFLGLFALSCLLLVFFSASIMFLSPSTTRNIENTSRRNWDRHGAGVGLTGRRALVRAIITYSPSPSRRAWKSVFPPPFNIVSLLLAAMHFPQKAGKVAWRLVVAPFAIVVAGFWVWGLL